MSLQQGQYYRHPNNREEFLNDIGDFTEKEKEWYRMYWNCIVQGWENDDRNPEPLAKVLFYAEQDGISQERLSEINSEYQNICAGK